MSAMPDATRRETVSRAQHVLYLGILSRDRLLPQGKELLQLGR